MNTIILFYIPVPNEEAGKHIGSQLVERKLAACTNLFPIQSCYFWDGAICQDSELVLIVKTLSSFSVELEKAALEIHPYEVPCIIRWEAQANDAYLEWMKEQLR